MSWFKNNKGADINVLRKTKYWREIEALIETDSETHQRLVQYVYEQVSDTLIDELNRIGKEAEKMTLIQELREHLAHRIKLLTGYKLLAFSKKEEEKNG